MKVTFLGTAAATACPLVFCSCPMCAAGFGQTAFTGDEIKRIRWYDIILYLTMMIEVYYREYETESQYFWAKDKLMTVWSDEASF